MTILEIKSKIIELKGKFKNCSTLKAEDLISMLDLIELITIVPDYTQLDVTQIDYIKNK